MRKCKTFICILLACIALFAAMPIGAYAGYTPIDPSAKGSLTIEYKYESMPISGAHFQIYYVASVSSDVRFTADPQFIKYKDCLDNNTVDSWRSLAYAMKGDAQADKLTMFTDEVTNADGRFTLSGIKTGLYLVVGVRRTIDGYTYIAEPTLVCVPSFDKVKEEWNYGVTIMPKKDRSENPSEDDPKDRNLTRKVLISWDDSGDTSKRPKSVNIRLMRNGVLYDNVTVTAEDNWRYVWDNLPAYDESNTKIEWTISETEVPGYNLAGISKTGITFVVLNKLKVVPTPTPTSKPYPGPSPYLPQTGLLWWPVPVLLCLGLVLLVVGIVLRRKEKQ